MKTNPLPAPGDQSEAGHEAAKWLQTSKHKCNLRANRECRSGRFEEFQFRFVLPELHRVSFRSSVIPSGDWLSAMDDRFVFPLLIAGMAVAAIGLLWLLVRAFRTGFVAKAILPVLVVAIGLAVAGFGPVYNRVVKPPVDTKVKVEEKVTSTGETVQELTGTGADTDELKAKLAAAKHYSVIQIADKGLTDDDLTVLEGMDRLTFIDLNDNPVTDATLERLVKLPSLTRLYAARTGMTATGVKQHVLDNPECKLTEIDFRGLTPPVSGKDLREWKAKDKDRRKFNN